MGLKVRESKGFGRTVHGSEVSYLYESPEGFVSVVIKKGCQQLRPETNKTEKTKIIDPQCTVLSTTTFSSKEKWSLYILPNVGEMIGTLLPLDLK